MFVIAINDFMEGSLQILKKELIQRWVDAHKEIGNIPVYEAKVVSKKYADGSRYNLKDYNAGKLRAGGKMLAEPPSGVENYHEYGFDVTGFPVTSRSWHVFNKIEWFGFYRREEGLIEYIEFCVTSGVVASINRIKFDKKNKVARQYFNVNGNTHSGLDVSDPFENIFKGVRQDTFNFLYDVREFDYVNNKIYKAYGLGNSGLGEFRYRDDYSYNADDQLLKIERFFNNGESGIDYLKPSKKGLKQIIRELANIYCDYLIEVLKGENYRHPLFVVELTYSYCDSYRPNVCVIHEKNKIDALNESNKYLFMSGMFSYAIDNQPPELDELYAEFYQMIEKTDNWDAGVKMLTETAKLMTQSKLKGQVPVTDDFIVFPVEWPVDGEDVEKILFQCGASKANIKRWKEYKWF